MKELFRKVKIINDILFEQRFGIAFIDKFFFDQLPFVSETAAALLMDILAMFLYSNPQCLV